MPFADYGFNASHACAYAYVAYQTAYLKAHHPVEYMSAILTSVKDDKDRKPFYLNACRLMGLEVLPPDVNESELDFAPVSGGEPKVRYGLSAVRNVGRGRGAADHRGPADQGGVRLVRRLLPQGGPGGPDEEGPREPGPRRGVRLARLQRGRPWSRDTRRCPDPIAAERKAEAAGQYSLFGGGERAAHRDRRVRARRADEFDKRTLLRLEKEMLGQFVTDHPLLSVKERLAAQTDMEVSEVVNLGDGDLVTVGGHRGVGGPPVHEEGGAVRAVPAGGPGGRRDGGGLPGGFRAGAGRWSRPTRSCW